MLDIYAKQLRKKWLAYSAISFVTAGFSLLMVVLWPSFEPFAPMLQEMMDLPFYAALIGETSGFSSVEGLLTMELFILSDIFYMGIILLFGVQCITREVDSGSLDFMMSFPVSRKRILLEKFFAYLTVTASFPILTAGGALLGALIIPGIEFHPRGLVAFFLGLICRWVLYMTLTSVVILISVIFMETGKTLAFGGLLLGGSFLLDILAGFVRMADETIADIIQYISFYYYLDGLEITDKIIKEGYSVFPFGQLVFILAIGVVAILGALLIFDNPFGQKREFK
ncbi:MAG: ABC transporter permease subunit [Candidatus Hodarchaeales archaeon]|jgi:ABC-type transport system involved in multi-copper enzyme maturation permease subunit